MYYTTHCCFKVLLQATDLRNFSYFLLLHFVDLDFVFIIVFVVLWWWSASFGALSNVSWKLSFVLMVFLLYTTPSIHCLSVQHPSSSSSPSSSWPVDTIQSHNNTLRNFYNISNMVFCFSFVFVVVYPCAFEMTISVANNMYTHLISDAVLKRYKTFRARTY